MQPYLWVQAVSGANQGVFGFQFSTSDYPTSNPPPVRVGDFTLSLALGGPQPGLLMVILSRAGQVGPLFQNATQFQLNVANQAHWNQPTTPRPLGVVRLDIYWNGANGLASGSFTYPAP